MGKSKPAEPDPEPAAGLAELVNRLAQELAEARRSLTAAQQRLGHASRTLEGRTRELTEARAALTLLLATLDSTTEGVLAMGHFGRAMHYNRRFMELWRIAPDALPTLNEPALLALQASQVRDPQRFLRAAEQRKAQPDAEHTSTVELLDGRILHCRVAPQRVQGKRVGIVTTVQDATAQEGLDESFYRVTKPSHTSFAPVRNMPA